MLNMHKEIPIEKINLMQYWGNASSRVKWQVIADLTIETDKCGYLCPRACLRINDETGCTILSLHNIRELDDVLKDNTVYKQICLLTETYQKGILPGTPEQMLAIRQGFATGCYSSMDFTVSGEEQIAYLKSRNLYRTPLENHDWYIFGHGWSEHGPVPSVHLVILKSLMGWP